jgi:hypothetical protein
MQRHSKITTLSTASLLVAGCLWWSNVSAQHRAWWMRKEGGSVSIKSEHLRKYVIRPALSPHGLWSTEAEELLMLTAAQESKLGYYLKQLGDGPGMGPWQMEADTFNWLRDGASFAFKNPLKGRHDSELIYDLRLGALAARLRYLVDPSPLPTEDDVEGLAKYWKRVYNTYKGKGKWEEAVQAYQYYVVEGKQ